LQSPRFDGTNFVSDFAGIIGRKYTLQWSSNLIDWNTFLTLSNSSGTMSFTNSSGGTARFYRSMLLP
jgi:hypothetical protein